MNKAQFIAALAPHFNDSKKDAAHAVDVVFDTIVRAMSRGEDVMINDCLLYTSPSPRDRQKSRMPSSA